MPQTACHVIQRMGLLPGGRNVCGLFPQGDQFADRPRRRPRGGQISPGCFRSRRRVGQRRGTRRTARRGQGRPGGITIPSLRHVGPGIGGFPLRRNSGIDGRDDRARRRLRLDARGQRPDRRIDGEPANGQQPLQLIALQGSALHRLPEQGK